MSFKNRPSSRVSVFLSAGSGFEAVSPISKTLHNLPSHTLTHTRTRTNAEMPARSPHLTHTLISLLFSRYASNSGFLSPPLYTHQTYACIPHTSTGTHHASCFILDACSHLCPWREHLPRCFVVSESVWEHTLEPELWVVGGKQM